VWRRRPLVACPGEEQRREATYSASTVSQPRKRSMAGLAPARPSPVSSRPVPRPDRSENPERTGSFSCSPGCRVNQQQLGAGSIITAPAPCPLLDLHCIALNGWDGCPPVPTPVRDAVAAGWYVCQGLAAGARRVRGRRRRDCPRSTATPGRAAKAGAPSSLFASLSRPAGLLARDH
jgi:hypothetical protein